MHSFSALTVDELDLPARQLLRLYPDSRLFALHGSMGSGKTTFIKAICHQLGVTDVVLSPTFSLINEYRTQHGEPVFHFDFYRINSFAEAFDMGYEEYFYSGNYCLIEWPEKIKQLLPESCVYIDIVADASTGERSITIRS